jgi:hypothetical protein
MLHSAKLARQMETPEQKSQDQTRQKKVRWATGSKTSYMEYIYNHGRPAGPGCAPSFSQMTHSEKLLVIDAHRSCINSQSSIVRNAGKAPAIAQPRCPIDGIVM